MNVQAIIAQQQAETRVVIRNFVSAIENGNLAALGPALCALLNAGLGRAGFHRAARLRSVRPGVQSFFLSSWVHDGDSLRCEIKDDRVLIASLRVLLPKYTELSAVRLYRGDSASNRRHRTYGVSWTADKSTAEGFAQGTMQMCEGGSVLLEALVPPEAIIFAIKDSFGAYDEAEYLVDRTKLKHVRVLQRFGQRAQGNPESNLGRSGNEVSHPDASPHDHAGSVDPNMVRPHCAVSPGDTSQCTPRAYLEP